MIAFLVIEFSYRMFLENDTEPKFSRKIMLFEAGKNFQNREGYFKYFPNKSIRSLTMYSKSMPKNIKDVLVVEYDYVISTNNVGLVMGNDVHFNDRVALVIGDSFTEGQGATPWFYQLENDFDQSSLKLVNLGILATGPMQWENLTNAITEELELIPNASVINIIPTDIIRKVWTFKDRELRCLHRVQCDYNFGFQGYNFHDVSNHEEVKLSLIKSLADEKLSNSVNEKVSNTSDFVTEVKGFLKKSHVIFDIYKFFYLDKSLKDVESRIVKMNEEALISIQELVKGNLFVNVVSQKSVNSTNFNKVPYARDLIKFLELNNINYSWCDIPSSRFHKNDGHPTVGGYEILKRCTSDALNKVIQ